MKPIWTKFNALGTEIIITAILNAIDEPKIKEAEEFIQDFEKRFSRFIKGNELDHFNTSSSEIFKASPIMADLLAKTKQMYLETDGIFDPTIIDNLEKIGYSEDFNSVKDDYKKIDPKKLKEDFLKRPRLKDLNINGLEIHRPSGIRIDFGGIGKGYVADFISQNIFPNIENFWVSAGGDLFLKGNSQNQTGWKIGIQDPNNFEKEIFSIDTKGQNIGIATSGIFKRKGVNDKFEWHHLIDPRNGFPVKNNILAVTAISSNAVKADVFGKTVLILGEKDGLTFIENQKDSACVIFFKNKEMVMSKNMLKYI